MGPIRVLYGQKKPIWGLCRTQMGLMPRISHMVPIYTCLQVEFYQYGTYMGLIWAKKSLYRTHVVPEWHKCPDSAHVGHIYTCLLGTSLPLQNGFRDMKSVFPSRENTSKG